MLRDELLCYGLNWYASAGRMQSPSRTSHRTVRNVPQFSAVLLQSSSPARHLVPPTFTVQAEDESDSTENERAL